MTISYHTSIHSEAASQPPPVPPAPWMPLGPLTELWAAFGKEATSREALLAARSAFAALADEREAIHTLNWLASTWPHSVPHTSAAAAPASFSLVVTQETIRERQPCRSLTSRQGEVPMQETDQEQHIPHVMRNEL